MQLLTMYCIQNMIINKYNSVLYYFQYETFLLKIINLFSDPEKNKIEI